MAARAPLSLKARAIGLLAQREHSRSELRRKLLRIEQQRARQAAMRRGAAIGEDGRETLPSEAAEMDDDAAVGVDADAVDALLDALAADGYLDETRFVESRLHLRSGRFGVQRIQQELAQHGLKLDAEQQATLRSSELERAREVWLRRFGPEPATDQLERARQTRFLLARGFAADVVRRLLRP
jgi:regulatory protein